MCTIIIKWNVKIKQRTDVINLKYRFRTIIIKWKVKIKQANRCNKVKI